MVVPGHDPARFLEDLARRLARRRELIADLVVKLQHRKMGLRDEKVLVVAVIADQRKPLGIARQVVAMIAGDGVDVDGLADQQLGARCLAAVARRIARIEMTASVGPRP